MTTRIDPNSLTFSGVAQSNTSTKNETFDTMMHDTITQLTLGVLAEANTSQTTEQIRERRKGATRYKLHTEFFIQQILNRLSCVMEMAEDDVELNATGGDLSKEIQFLEESRRDDRSFKQVLEDLRQEPSTALPSKKQEIIYLILLLKLKLMKLVGDKQDALFIGSDKKMAAAEQEMDDVCKQMERLQRIATMDLDFSKQLTEKVDSILIPKTLKTYSIASRFEEMIGVANHGLEALSTKYFALAEKCKEIEQNGSKKAKKASHSIELPKASHLEKTAKKSSKQKQQMQQSMTPTKGALEEIREDENKKVSAITQMRAGLGFSLYGLILHLTNENAKEKIAECRSNLELLSLGIGEGTESEIQQQKESLEREIRQHMETLKVAKRELHIEQIRRQILKVEKSIESNHNLLSGGNADQAVASRIEQLNGKLITLRESVDRLTGPTLITDPPSPPLSTTIEDAELPEPLSKTAKKKRQVTSITPQPQSSQPLPNAALDTSSPDISPTLQRVYRIQQLLISPRGTPLRTPVLYEGDTWDAQELPKGASSITNYAIREIVEQVTEGIVIEESVFDHVTFMKYQDAQILPCGHSFSREITEQVKKCPDCRQTFTLAELVPNTLLQKIVDAPDTALHS